MRPQAKTNKTGRKVVIGKVPIDWLITELGNLIEFPTRQVDPKIAPYKHMPLIAPNHIESGSGRLIAIQSAEDQAAISGKYPVEKHDVVYSKIRPYLQKVYYSEIDGLCSADMYPLKPTALLFNKYLYYLLLSHRFTFFANSQSGRTGIPKINREEMSQFPALLPPLSEQRSIAQLISRWDKAIELTTKIIDQKELRKNALMQKLLSGKKRLKGFKGRWIEIKLSDAFDRVVRKNTEGNTNVVTISAQRGFIKQSDYFNKIVASELLDNYFLVKQGEFAYNKSYSNGYPWGAIKRLNDFDKAVVTTLYICFCLKSKSNNSVEFFEQFFEAGHLDRGLTRIAHEGGRAHGLLNVTPDDFFNLKITIPEHKEQHAIADLLQTSDSEIRLLKLKLDKLKEQKKGLMQVLLTGKKRLIK